MPALPYENDEEITASYGGSEAKVRAFKSPVQEALAHSEDFMRRSQARAIQDVVSRKAAEWGHDAELWIRPASPKTVKRTEAGLPGKPESFKAKTQNGADIAAGYAKPENENLVGYFDPETIQKAMGVRIKIDPDNLDALPGEPPAGSGIKPSVWDRAMQRIKEYYYEKPMMDCSISASWPMLMRTVVSAMMVSQTTALTLTPMSWCFFRAPSHVLP